MKIDIEKRLSDDINAYCKLNGLNKTDFVNGLLKKAFTVEKYGEKPPFMTGFKSKPKETTQTIPHDKSFKEKSIEEQVVLHKIEADSEEMPQKNGIFVEEIKDTPIENRKKRKLL